MISVCYFIILFSEAENYTCITGNILVLSFLYHGKGELAEFYWQNEFLGYIFRVVAVSSSFEKIPGWIASYPLNCLL